jgi:hypothetical protein
LEFRSEIFTITPTGFKEAVRVILYIRARVICQGQGCWRRGLVRVLGRIRYGVRDL